VFVIPPAFINDLLARTDIVELVRRHVELRRTGTNWSGLCPFHAEKSPSFTVAPSKQFYHCFGCGAHGNAVGFLMEHSGMGFIDAVKDLAEQAGMTVPEEDTTPEERERAAALKKRQVTLTGVLAKAAEHYRRQLKANARGVDYLKGRGLSGEIAARFGLGYAPDGWRALASAFERYDEPLLEESGLVIAQRAESGDEAETKRYDRFRDRIMFPIRSVQGDVIGFGGRVLDAGEPKYLNSPETPVFVKGRELYGLFEARQAIRERGHVLVVEGYMDVVALAQSGFANAVATLGTACTAEHVQKLFRFTDSVVFSFDGDVAGRRAAGRALEASLPHATDTRSVRFLFLPAEHDPDSYVRERGAEAFERCIAEAVPLSRQLAAQAAEGCDLATPEGRSRMLATARPLWSALPDGAFKRQMMGELASQGGLPAGELAPLWGVGAAARAPSRALAPRRAATRRAQRISQGMASLLDRALWLLVQRSDLWATLDGESHDVLAAETAPYDMFFSCLERSLNEHGPLGSATLLAELRTLAEQIGAAAVVARVAAFHDPDPQLDLARELAIVIDRLRLQAAEEELKLLFDSGQLSPDAQQRGKQLMALQARLKSQLSKGVETPPFPAPGSGSAPLR
jgi:DNA primase